MRRLALRFHSPFRKSHFHDHNATIEPTIPINQSISQSVNYLDKAKQQHVLSISRRRDGGDVGEAKGEETQATDGEFALVTAPIGFPSPNLFLFGLM